MSSAILNRYEPDFVTPPGDILFEKLEEIGMTQAELAKRIGKTKKTVNQIVKGKAPIVSETALQLERVLSIPARFWTNAEGEYREFLAREQERRRLGTQLEWLKKLPVAKLVKLGWLPKRSDPVAGLLDVLNFFGVASVEALDHLTKERLLAFRQATVHRMDHLAVVAWIRKGEIEAQQLHCSPFDEKLLRSALSEVRKMTRQQLGVALPRMVGLLSGAGVALVVVPEIPGARAFGVTHWLNPDKAVIQLSPHGKKEDDFWFTLFHEVAHILLHPKRDVFVEPCNTIDTWEDEANRFATEILFDREKGRTLHARFPQSERGHLKQNNPWPP